MKKNAELIVDVTRLVECPFSHAIDMLADALRAKAIESVAIVGSARERVRSGWVVVDDFSDGARRHDAIALYWKPRHGAFPAFSGCVTVRPHYRQSSLRISGRYAPPFGRLGALFDRFVGRFIARATLRRLLDELGAEIESRYLVYLEEICPAGADGHSGRERDQVLRSN